MRTLRGILTVSVSLGAVASGFAQEPAGDIKAGKQLAEASCSACHRVDAQVGAAQPAPDFYAIANFPLTTASALKVFLRNSHGSMQNFRLTAADADDVIAYVLSLRKN